MSSQTQSDYSDRTQFGKTAKQCIFVSAASTVNIMPKVVCLAWQDFLSVPYRSTHKCDIDTQNPNDFGHLHARITEPALSLSYVGCLVNYAFEHSGKYVRTAAKYPETYGQQNPSEHAYAPQSRTCLLLCVMCVSCSFLQYVNANAHAYAYYRSERQIHTPILVIAINNWSEIPFYCQRKTVLIPVIQITDYYNIM